MVISSVTQHRGVCVCEKERETDRQGSLRPYPSPYVNPVSPSFIPQIL